MMVGNPQTRMVYAIGENNSAQQQTGLSTFRLTTGGKLKQVGPTIYSGNPRQGSLDLDPLGRYLYVFDLSSSKSLYVININADGTLGTQVTGSPFAVGSRMTFTGPDDPNACFFASADQVLVANPNGKNLYISCTAGRQLTELGVSSTGKVSVKRSVPLASSLDFLSSLAVDAAGKFLFGTEENRNSVVVFSLNPTNGAPTEVSVTPAGTRPNSVASNPNDSSLYVTNGSSNVYKGNFVAGSDNLSYYSLGSDGSLTQPTGSPIATGQGPRSVIVVQR
jgi:6-phosphogluconolactonase (cycloisomerase 2 family)